MTREQLEKHLGRLMVLRGVPAGTDSHWEALQDMPEDVFAAAVGYALKSREWFPVPAELRMDADQVRRDVRPMAPEEPRDVPLEQPFTVTVPHVGTVVAIAREWRYYCDICSDGAWDSRWCGARTPATKPWQGDGDCGRHATHEPHEFVSRCACRDTNPALVRKRENQRAYAEKPAEKRYGRG